jgi:hypothetical protein
MYIEKINTVIFTSFLPRKTKLLFLYINQEVNYKDPMLYTVLKKILSLKFEPQVKS